VVGLSCSEVAGGALCASRHDWNGWTNIKWLLMTIAEIINEIDAYLLCLRHARDVLLAPMTEARLEGESRHKRVVKASKTGRPFLSKPRIREKKSRFDRKVAPAATPEQRVNSASRVHGSVAPQAAVLTQPPVAVTPQKPQQDVPIERLPSSDRRMSSTRTARRPVTKRAFGTILETKPAIALAGPIHSKILVVSAEQAQRERERAAQSEVRRPRVPASGLTGKLAFEALFNDGSDTSKNPRR
jgi:hypothetical protein